MIESFTWGSFDFEELTEYLVEIIFMNIYLLFIWVGGGVQIALFEWIVQMKEVK